MALSDYDQKVAAYVREANHGVPPFEHLTEPARDWWRAAYERHLLRQEYAARRREMEGKS